MDNLLELVQVVTKNKIKEIDILDQNGKETRVFDFYDKIKNKEFTTDDEASRHYFSSEPNNPQYRKLKNKLKDKLINTTFFIDTSSPKFNDAQKAFYTCQKNLYAIRILIGRYARKTALDLVFKTLKYSEKYELTPITLELYRILRSHYSVISTNKKLYKKYYELVEKYQEIDLAEDLILKHYEHIAVLLRKRNADIPSIVLKIDEFLKEVDPYLKKYDAFKLHLFYFFLLLRKFDLTNDQKQIIELCQNAIDFLTAKKTVSNHFIGPFYYNQLMSCIRLAKYDQALSLAKKCQEIFEPETIRWFNYLQMHFILCLHSGRYSEALQVRNKVVSSSVFKYQMQNRQEFWHLFDAYLFYLTKVGKLDFNNDSKLATFRLKKFLNEVPFFSTDKQGYNIPVLVIQILILICDRKFDQLSDRMEAIEKYSTRYLKKDNNYRSNCFIKMLLQIPKHRFHKTAITRHSKKYLTRLREFPLSKSNQPFEIEIIPYEHLWEYTLESLDNKFR